MRYWYRYRYKIKLTKRCSLPSFRLFVWHDIASPASVAGSTSSYQNVALRTRHSPSGIFVTYTFYNKIRAKYSLIDHTDDEYNLLHWRQLLSRGGILDLSNEREKNSHILSPKVTIMGNKHCHARFRLGVTTVHKFDIRWYQELAKTN